MRRLDRILIELSGIRLELQTIRRLLELHEQNNVNSVINEMTKRLSEAASSFR